MRKLYTVLYNFSRPNSIMENLPPGVYTQPAIDLNLVPHVFKYKFELGSLGT